MSIDPQNQFEVRDSDPVSWVYAARSLRLAADAVRTGHPTAIIHEPGNEWLGGNHVWVGPVSLMLMGMALECLLKGVIHAAGVRPRKTHNLGVLWQATGLQAPEGTEDFTRRLTEAIIWFGRYPLPRNEHDFHASNGLRFTDSDDRTMFALLWDILLAEFVERHEILRRRWREEAGLH